MSKTIRRVKSKGGKGKTQKHSAGTGKTYKDKADAKRALASAKAKGRR